MFSVACTIPQQIEWLILTAWLQLIKTTYPRSIPSWPRISSRSSYGSTGLANENCVVTIRLRGLRRRVVKVVDFKSLHPHRCRYESHGGVGFFHVRQLSKWISDSPSHLSSMHGRLIYSHISDWLAVQHSTHFDFYQINFYVKALFSDALKLKKWS